MDWISVVLTVTGSLLVANKKILGFFLFIAANATWIVWAATSNPVVYSVVSLNFMYFAINVFAIVRWSRRSL